MPKCWIDRLIIFAVTGLVAWGIIGLPTLQLFPTSGSEEHWLTKDAAGFFTFLLVVVGLAQVSLFLWQLWLIRETLEDTKIAADAAKVGAQAARDSADTA